MNKPKLIAGLVIVFFLGAFPVAWGEQSDVAPTIKPKAEKSAKYESTPGMFKNRMPRCDKIINELDLTADQKKQVDAILAKNREERKSLIKDLMEARKQLKVVASEKEFNETAFRQAFQKVSSIKENMAVTRAKMIPELRVVLSPEQIGYLRGRMATKNDLCMKGFGRSRWHGHHGSFGRPDMHHQKYQKQGGQTNS